MPNILQLCLRFISIHPFTNEAIWIDLSSGMFNILPGEGLFVDFVPTIAGRILRAMIRSADFAEGMAHVLSKIFKDGGWGPENMESQTREALLNTFLGKRSKMVSTHYFCCVIILMETIRQREDHFQTLKEISRCISTWKEVCLC